jgi:ABC-type branched-subunit amino acid transport system substrate-binding protein
VAGHHGTAGRLIGHRTIQKRGEGFMTQRTGIFVAALAGLAFAGPVAACPAKVGATLSLTGSYATFGPPISNAAALAVEQMNAAGWKVGDCAKIDYLVRDDQTQPSVGVDAARRLVDLDGVPALVGPITSGVTGPILSSVTVEKGVLMIPSASSSPTFSEMARDGKLNGLFFRIQPSDALQAVAAAKLAWDAGHRNIAIVNLNNDWGNNLSKQFAATFKAMGGKVAAQVTYNAEQPSYRGEVNKALESKPDSAFVISTVIDGSKILRDWISLGGTQKFVFPLGMNDSKLIEQIGEQYLKDSWFVTPGAPLPNSRAVFYEAYEKRYGFEAGKGVGPGRDTGYDAAAIISLAMVAAKDYRNGKAIAAAVSKVTDPAGTPISTTVEDYKKAIQLLSEGKTIRYVGASGAMVHDRYGDVTTPFVGWQVENKAYVQKKNVTAEEVAEIKQKTGT